MSTGTNKKENTILKGSLNLCDLAGSERLDKSGAVSKMTHAYSTRWPLNIILYIC